MKALFLSFILAVQGASAFAQQPAKGAVSGVVVNAATGDPLPNVRVTLARIDVSKTGFAALSRLVGSDSSGAPPAEMTLSPQFFEMMKSSMALVGSLGAAGNGGVTDVPDDPILQEMAIFNDLPVDTIHSVLVDPSGKLGIVSKSAPPVRTDGVGRFRFQNLDPGLYRVIFAANGFVKQDYGQRGAGNGTPVVVAAGASRDDVMMRMMPAGSLAGRLSDNAGQPLAGIPINLQRVAYDGTGKRKAKTVASTQTNDRGEYRFYYLTPGRYMVQAGNPGAGRSSDEDIAAALTGNRTQANPNRIADPYPLLYYPGTPDAAAATAVEVGPGAEVSGINLVLTALRYYRVRGRIVDPRSGQPPQSASIRLTNPDDATGLSGISGLGSDASYDPYDPSDGSFDLRNVAAGKYILRVDLPSLNQNSSRNALSNIRNMSPAEREAAIREMADTEAANQATIPRIAVPVAVNGDIEGLTLTGILGTGIGGKVRIEPVGVAGLRLDQVNLELQALSPDGTPVAGYDNTVRASGRAKTDGTFRIEGILAGEHGIGRSGLPAGFFVKSARVGEMDALNGGLTLPIQDPNAVLDVVISKNTGQIEGAVTQPDGFPWPGAQVVLIPDNNRKRTELFRFVVAEADGRFAIQDVVPGSYHLAAWSSLEPFGYFDPDLIRQAEENGRAVKVEESSQQKVDVPIFVVSDTP